MDKNEIYENVYDILQLIPLGYVTTYKCLADFLRVHQRTIAAALRNNKRHFIIPCHRVIKSNGDLAGYTPYGREAKKILLISEGVEIIGNKVSEKHIIRNLSKFLENYY
ncbi:MAG: cysteine methyltransferase [Caldisphaera sp.]|jgi:O-6-methylguanine DNA methyltransferase|nr:MAG: cysteine methyltransferase [Caldisphaera sp.]PMP90528.1 MAG: cysteine methyltransferase [Caldisphaera sp.]